VTVANKLGSGVLNNTKGKKTPSLIGFKDGIQYKQPGILYPQQL